MSSKQVAIVLISLIAGISLGYGVSLAQVLELQSKVADLEAEWRSRYAEPNSSYTDLSAAYSDLLEQQYRVSVLEDTEYYYSIRNHLGEANETILIAMYSMNYDPDDSSDWANGLITELVSARDRGADVTVIIEYRTYFGYMEENLEAYKYLLANNISVQLDYGEDTDHMKLVIIDDEIVYVGSHDWSESSLHHNHETSLMIVSEEIAEIFKACFEDIAEEVSLEKRDAAARALVDRFNPRLQLVYESPIVHPDWYWLVSDNLLAQHVLMEYYPNIAKNIRTRLIELAARYGLPTNAEGLPISFKHEAVLGERVPIPFNITNFYDLEIGENYVIKTEVLNSTEQMLDWQEYIDGLCYASLSKHYENNSDEAKLYFDEAAGKWDGIGLADKGFFEGEQNSKYETYKLALLLFTSKKLGIKLKYEKDLHTRIWACQNREGGIITHYLPDGRPDGDANSETTAFVLLACARALQVTAQLSSETVTQGDDVTISAMVKDEIENPIEGATVTATIGDLELLISFSEQGNGSYQAEIDTSIVGIGAREIVVNGEKEGYESSQTSVTLNVGAAAVPWALYIGIMGVIIIAAVIIYGVRR